MAVADTEQAGIVRFDVRIQFGLRVENKINILSTPSRCLYSVPQKRPDRISLLNKPLTRMRAEVGTSWVVLVVKESGPGFVVLGEVL